MLLGLQQQVLLWLQVAAAAASLAALEAGQPC
jgi:hypothetical protein